MSRGWIRALALMTMLAAGGAPQAQTTAAPSAATPSAVGPSALWPATTEAAGGTAAAGTSATGTTATGTSAPAGSLDSRIQAAKAEVIRLNRDLLALEEELLYPAGTQVAMFVSMDVGKLFALDSVQIRVDDKLVANHLYTPREVQALHRGGVQRVWLGNLKAGEHEIVATFTGQGPHERDYKRGTTLRFDKGSEPKYIELQIRDSAGKLQPEFEVKVWQ